MEDSTGKKAILIAAFGTSYPEVRRAAIDPIVEKTRLRYPGYELRLAYTSEMIIRKLKERDGVLIDNPLEALARLREDGFDTVVIQPLHIVPGYEWKKVARAIRRHRPGFSRLALGRPLLFFSRGESTPDDYGAAVEALRTQLPPPTPEQAVLLMAHGSTDPANACYVCFARVLRESGLERVMLASVEGYPTLEDIEDELKADNIEKITLMPFMLVAGDHAINDMAGEEEDSWKRRLQREGYQVEAVLLGLGENEGFQEIYLRHIQDAIDGTYDRYLAMDLD